MSTRTTDYLDAVEHLPEGATLVIPQVSWDDYESLVEELEQEGRHVRVSYDRGRMEILSPTFEHDKYGRLIDRLIYFIAEMLEVKIEAGGTATWKRQKLARGVEADCCYYVANADRVIGKRKLDLETEPPPDIVVEIDIANLSLTKFSIHAALGVPEIWRYDGKRIQFYELAGKKYREVSKTPSFPGLTPAMLETALEESKTEGQTAALRAFRKQWDAKR